MKIHILMSGQYMDLNNPDRTGKLKAVSLKAGDIVDYDPWYAQELLTSGLAALMTPVYAEEVGAASVMSLADELLERVVSVAEVAPEEKASVDITKAAQRLVNKYGIDPTDVRGSGVAGRITTKDVMTYLKPLYS